MLGEYGHALLTLMPSLQHGGDLVWHIKEASTNHAVLGPNTTLEAVLRSLSKTVHPIVRIALRLPPDLVALPTAALVHQPAFGASPVSPIVYDEAVVGGGAGDGAFAPGEDANPYELGSPLDAFAHKGQRPRPGAAGNPSTPKPTGSGTEDEPTYEYEQAAELLVTRSSPESDSPAVLPEAAYRTGPSDATARDGNGPKSRRVSPEAAYGPTTPASSSPPLAVATPMPLTPSRPANRGLNESYNDSIAPSEPSRTIDGVAKPSARFPQPPAALRALSSPPQRRESLPAFAVAAAAAVPGPPPPPRRKSLAPWQELGLRTGTPAVPSRRPSELPDPNGAAGPIPPPRRLSAAPGASSADASHVSSPHRLATSFPLLPISEIDDLDFMATPDAKAPGSAAQCVEHRQRKHSSARPVVYKGGNSCGRSAEAQLARGAKRGNVKRVSLLLDSGVDVDTIKLNGKGRTPLFLAAARGHREVVQLLIKRGADPSVRDINGVSVAEVASRAGHIDVAVFVKTALLASR